jgi:hypothetical protein
MKNKFETIDQTQFWFVGCRKNFSLENEVLLFENEYDRFDWSTIFRTFDKLLHLWGSERFKGTCRRNGFNEEKNNKHRCVYTYKKRGVNHSARIKQNKKLILYTLPVRGISVIDIIAFFFWLELPFSIVYINQCFDAYIFTNFV